MAEPVDIAARKPPSIDFLDRLGFVVGAGGLFAIVIVAVVLTHDLLDKGKQAAALAGIAGMALQGGIGALMESGRRRREDNRVE